MMYSSSCSLFMMALESITMYPDNTIVPKKQMMLVIRRSFRKKAKKMKGMIAAREAPVIPQHQLISPLMRLAMVSKPIVIKAVVTIAIITLLALKNVVIIVIIKLHIKVKATSKM